MAITSRRGIGSDQFGVQLSGYGGLGVSPNGMGTTHDQRVRTLVPGYTLDIDSQYHTPDPDLEGEDEHTPAPPVDPLQTHAVDTQHPHIHLVE